MWGPLKQRQRRAPTLKTKQVIRDTRMTWDGRFQEARPELVRWRDRVVVESGAKANANTPTKIIHWSGADEVGHVIKGLVSGGCDG